MLTIAFGALALWVRGGNALAFDQMVHRAVRPDDDAGPVRFAAVGRDMGTYAAIIGVLPAFWFARRRLWLAAGTILGSVLGVLLLNLVLKGLIGRTRPGADEIVTNPGGYLFPSTHTVMTVVCYGLPTFLFCIHFPRWRALVLALYACVVAYVGFCLIYLDTHYSTDVLAGILVGSCWLIVSFLALADRNDREPRGQMRR